MRRDRFMRLLVYMLYMQEAIKESPLLFEIVLHYANPRKGILVRWNQHFGNQTLHKIQNPMQTKLPL